MGRRCLCLAKDDAASSVSFLCRATTNKVVALYGMDAGTDSGVSYASPDQVTVPRGVVREFTGFPALVNGVITVRF